jgi:SAM-dependent methyltransferase
MTRTVFPQSKPPAYHDQANPALLERVPPGAVRVLDVGCGAGALGAALKRLNPVRSVVGLEADPVAAAVAQTRLDDVFVLDVERADPPRPVGGFDCTIYGDVLEHLIDPEAVLRRHRRLLAPGGVAVCSIPNVQHHTVLASLLRGDFPYAPAGLLDATHLRFFTAASAAKLLLDAGYVPELTGVTEVGPPDPRFLAAAAPLLRYLGAPVEWARHQWTAYQYLFRASPLPDDPSDGGAEPVTLVCCLSDEAVAADNLLRSPDLDGPDAPELLLVRGCRSAADGLGEGLRRAGTDLVVGVHQDVYLPRGWVRRFARRVREAERVVGPVGVVGVYGAVGGPQPTRVGRVFDRNRLLAEPTPLPAPVETVDEVVVAVRKSAGVVFDPALGFHLYAADACAAARDRGLAAVVVDAVCFHNSLTQDVPDAFYVSAAALARKWTGRLPVTTPTARILESGRVAVW